MKKLNKVLSGKVVFFLILTCTLIYIAFSFVHKASIIDTATFKLISLCCLFVGLFVLSTKMVIITYRISSGQIMEEAIEQAQKEENEGEEPLNNLDQLVEHYYRLITSIYDKEISEVKISTKDFLIVYVDDNKIDLRLAFKEKNVVEKRRISQIEILFTSDLTTGVVEERLNQKFKLRKY
ncbi:MAG: hypothetical protein MR674_04065 [Erysipelotrichaceae bacterium]|nr:hypothetical protein [Erysipelotrichaceae bacterium]MDY6142536.1 hypothetical protein [Bacilli bacterium]